MDATTAVPFYLHHSTIIPPPPPPAPPPLAEQDVQVQRGGPKYRRSIADQRVPAEYLIRLAEGVDLDSAANE